MGSSVDEMVGTLSRKLSVPAQTHSTRFSSTAGIDGMSPAEVFDVLTKRLSTDVATRFVVLCRVINPSAEKALRRLNRKAFLKSVYWSVVREYVRDARQGCDACGSRRGLWVLLPGRHTGTEHRENDRLRVLCKVHRGRN